MAYTIYERIENDEMISQIYNYLQLKGYSRTIEILVNEHQGILGTRKREMVDNQIITETESDEGDDNETMIEEKLASQFKYALELETKQIGEKKSEVTIETLTNTYRNKNGSLWNVATQLVAGYETNDVYGATSIPIYQTSTFEQPSVSNLGIYDYTRSGNPTRQILEKQVAALEYGTHAFAFSTGMAAISSVAHLAKSGDEIIVCDDCYGGTYRLVSKLLSKYGIHIHYVDLSGKNGPNNLLSVINSHTKVVMIESPTNPLQKICNIQALADIVHKYSAYLSVDNTMLSPILQNPLTLGADIVIHSGTKFLNGQADTMSGMVIVKDKYIAEEIYFYQNAEGTALSPFDCWLTARGLKTMALRVQKAEQNARIIANFLNNHSLVTKVYYTGIHDPSNEASHMIHNAQARGCGSVISFCTGNVALSEHIAEHSKLFKITVSFGSVNSLISLPSRMSHASIPENVRKARCFPEDLVRISIGIEDAEDLVNDLKEAFNSYIVCN